VPVNDNDCGLNGMSAHPGEVSEAAHSIPQDWASTARYLARHGAVLGPGGPRQLAGEYGNLNYFIEIDGKPAVRRRPPTGRLPPGPNDMAREYRTVSSLWQESPLAPCVRNRPPACRGTGPNQIPAAFHSLCLEVLPA